MQFKAIHYTYGRPIKPRHSTRVYESRAEFGHVNRNDIFTTHWATRTGFGNRKGDTVKIPMSRHTCRRRKDPLYDQKARGIRFSVGCLTCLRQVFFFFFSPKSCRSNDRRIRLIRHLMPELGVPTSAACIFYESLFISSHAHRATRIPVGTSFPANNFSTRYQFM